MHHLKPIFIFEAVQKDSQIIIIEKAIATYHF